MVREHSLRVLEAGKPPDGAPAGVVGRGVRDELAGRGVETSRVDKQPWGWFIYFSDPDGNTWSVQQIIPPQ